VRNARKPEPPRARDPHATHAPAGTEQPDAGRSSRSTSGGLRPAALARPARSLSSLSMSTPSPPARPPSPTPDKMSVARATEERNTTEPARFNDLRWMPTHCAGVEEWLNPGGGEEGGGEGVEWCTTTPAHQRGCDILSHPCPAQYQTKLSGIPCPVSALPFSLSHAMHFFMTSSLFNYYSSHAHCMSTMSFLQSHRVIQAHLYVRGGMPVEGGWRRRGGSPCFQYAGPCGMSSY
jgi:hypothetical protein